MSNRKSQFVPERILEFLEPKSGDKRPCARSRLEPVRILELLESASKVRPSSVEKLTGTGFAIPKKPVRRALYVKPPLKPSPKPPSSTSSQSSAEVKILPKSEKKIVKARKSLLPQPNSIAQRYIKKVEACSIIEKKPLDVEEPLPQVCQQRPTVIRSAVKKTLTFNDAEENSTITNPGDSNEQLNDDLEASIADKENIPPVKSHKAQPLEEKTIQYDLELKQYELYTYFKSRMDKIEENQSALLNQINYNHSTVMDAVEKMFKMLTILVENSKPISISEVSSTPQVEISVSNPKDDKENLTSEKKKRRSKTVDGERRRSLRLAIRSAEKNDSFVIMENQLYETCNNQKSPLNKMASSSATPRSNKRMSIKSKSDRPLREYLALKATTPFLETPDHTGFKKKLQINSTTPAMQKSLRRSISSKLYDELKDLYNDSIEESTID